MNLPAYVQCSQQGEYILLSGTNLCINFKITSSACLKMMIEMWHAQGGVASHLN